MKKTAAFLIISILLCGFVFAATTGNTIRIKSAVGAITIEQANENAMAQGESGVFILTIGSSEDSAGDRDIHNSAWDISFEDVSAYFRVVQTSKTKTNESISLNVTAGKLTLSAADGSIHESGSPVVSSFKGNPDNAAVFVNGTPSENTIKLDISYSGYAAAVEADTVLATFTAVWARQADLASFDGEYFADITLEYTIE